MCLTDFLSQLYVPLFIIFYVIYFLYIFYIYILFMLMQVGRRDIKLIILDSIAALLRSDHSSTAAGGSDTAAALTARGELLGQQAAVLKSIAEAHRIPVIVTNQVSMFSDMLYNVLYNMLCHFSYVCITETICKQVDSFFSVKLDGRNCFVSSH